MKRFVFIAVLLLVLFLSCDDFSGVGIINDTDKTILIEWETVRLRGDVDGDSPMMLTKGNTDYLLALVPSNGTDIIQYLGYGNIDSMNDVVSAIDRIFTRLDVYTYEDSVKKLLYSKEYFLDRQNIKIKGGNVLLTVSREWKPK
ncbi:MAG: hypothetical protein LBH44_04745 [Treponema sp.]|jgi:hypothetical protein|nr:hypothetical protein [Treponema sp.]